MNKFKVGDVVVVKSLEEIQQSACRDAFIYSGMTAYCGKMYTISHIRDMTFKRDGKEFPIYMLKSNSWSWSEEWLELVPQWEVI